MQYDLYIKELDTDKFALAYDSQQGHERDWNEVVLTDWNWETESEAQEALDELNEYDNPLHMFYQMYGD